MKNLEVNPKLVNALIKLREATVEIEEVLTELEKREVIDRKGIMEDFNDGMSTCLFNVAIAIGFDARQRILKSIPKKQ